MSIPQPLETSRNVITYIIRKRQKCKCVLLPFSPVFLKGFDQVEWVYVGSVTLHRNSVFVDNEFCEIPFDEVPQGTALLVLNVKKKNYLYSYIHYSHKTFPYYVQAI